MKRVFVLGALVLMSTWVPSHAQGTKADPNPLVEEVLELSGARRQIAQIPAVVQAGAAQQKTGLKPEDEAKINRIIAESYQVDALYQTVRAHLQQHFDRQRFGVLLQWLRSPLARKISGLEVRASTPQAVQEMQQFATQLHRNPPGRERLTLLRKLDETTGMTEFNIEMIVSSFRELAKAIDPMLPPEKRLKKGELEHLTNDMRAQVAIPVKNEVMLTLLYTYHPLTESELRAYLAFLESATGKWFSRVASDALLTAMRGAAARVGREVGKTFSSETPPKGI